MTTRAGAITAAAGAYALALDERDALADPQAVAQAAHWPGHPYTGRQRADLYAQLRAEAIGQAA